MAYRTIRTASAWVAVYLILSLIGCSAVGETPSPSGFSADLGPGDDERKQMHEVFIDLSYKAGRQVIETIYKTPGFTKDEISTIKDIGLEITKSRNFHARSSLKNGLPTITLSSAFVELSTYLISELNPFRETGNSDCIVASKGISKLVQNDNRPLLDIFKEFKHNCPYEEMSNEEYIFIISGFLAIPIAHEVAHILRGDVYRRRDEDISTSILIEYNADQFSSQILGSNKLVYYGLTSLIFLKNEKMKRGQNHPYLPILCRARILSLHAGGIESINFYHHNVADAPDIIRSDIMKVFLERVELEKHIGGGIECPVIE